MFHVSHSVAPLLALIILSAIPARAGDDPARSHLPIVRAFVDNVLKHGRDVYGPNHTPLLIDGNSFQMMLIDGTKLPPADVKRPGGLEPGHFRKRLAGPRHFWAYSLAAAMTGDQLLWDTARSMGQTLTLGDIGGGPKAVPALNPDTPAVNPYLVFALLDLHRKTNQADYLRIARRIGDNLVEREFNKGFFTDSPDVRFAKFDSTSRR